MKEEFLKNLRKALNEHKVQNVDEILEKYEKRFTLGYEAGMQDDEIIEAMEPLDDIICQYQKKNYELYLDLTYFSDFEIQQKNHLNQPFVLDLDDFDDEEDQMNQFVQIQEENKRISLKTTEECGEKLSGALYISSTIEFDKIYIVTKTCDLDISSLKAKEIYIKNVSGDCCIDKLQADEVKLETISGDIEIDEIISDHLILTSASGDISLGKVNALEVDIATVSGDIEIEQLAAGSGKISSVSGDIYYSEYENNHSNVSITTVSGTIEEE